MNRNLIAIQNTNPKLVIALELTIFMAFLVAVNWLVPASITFRTIIIPVRVPFLLMFVWMSLKWRRLGWENLGLQPPENWLNTILKGVGLGIALQVLTISVTGPIIRQITGARQDLSLFLNMADGNFLALLGWLAVSWLVAAFGEEIVYRGYLMNRFGDLNDLKPYGWLLGLFATTLLFGSVHAYQGINGVFLAGITGLAHGIIYWVMRRNLWVCIICHGTTNTLGFILVYILLQCCPGMVGS